MGRGFKGPPYSTYRLRLRLSRLCDSAVLGSQQPLHVFTDLDDGAFVEVALLLLDVSVLDGDRLPVPTSSLPPGRYLCSRTGEMPHF